MGGVTIPFESQGNWDLEGLTDPRSYNCCQAQVVTARVRAQLTVVQGPDLTPPGFGWLTCKNSVHVFLKVWQKLKVEWYLVTRDVIWNSDLGVHPPSSNCGTASFVPWWTVRGSLCCAAAGLSSCRGNLAPANLKILTTWPFPEKACPPCS